MAINFGQNEINCAISVVKVIKGLFMILQFCYNYWKMKCLNEPSHIKPKPYPIFKTYLFDFNTFSKKIVSTLENQSHQSKGAVHKLW